MLLFASRPALGVGEVFAMDSVSKVRRLVAGSLLVLLVLSGAAAPAQADAEADEARTKGLIRQLKNNRTRPMAIRELAKLGKPAVDGLIDALGSVSSGIYPALVQSALVGMGPGMVEHVTPMLKHRNTTVRKVGLRTLGEFGPMAAPAVARIMKILEAPDPTAQMGLRRYAAEALGKIGPASAPAARLLAEALTEQEDVHGLLREAALMALGRIGSPANDAALDVAKILGNENYTSAHRQLAARVLGAMGGPADVVVPVLRDALRDNPDTPIAQQAVAALGKVGPGAKEAVGDIVAALDTKAVGYRGLQALASIGPGAAEAVPELTKRLASSDGRQPRYAAEALGRIGPPAKTAVGDLVKTFRALKDDDPCRVAVAVALARIKGYPSRAVPYCVTCLESDSAEIRAAAFDALGSLGEKARGALPALVLLVGGKDREPGGKASQAIVTLGRMGTVAKPAVSYLIKVITAREESRRAPKTPLRLAAIEAIAKIDPKDPVVLQALKTAAAEDPNPEASKLAMKTAALIALQNAGGSK